MLIKSELEQMLHSLEMERKKCNDEIAGLPAGTLISSVRNKQPVYFNALGTKETYRRISINSDEETKRGLARKKYLQLRLMRIEEDIAALRNANQRISGMTNDSVIQQMPRAYRQLPTEYFFPQMSGWAEEPYIMSDYKPEMRRHSTSRGLKVRSKSELIIAEKYYEYNIPFRYEQVIVFGNTSLAPDFTIRMEDGRMFYWEHCGMTNDENYIRHHRWKMNIYEKMDIVPWKNLIVTYDDEYGNVSIPLIESEIKYKLMKF